MLSRNFSDADRSGELQNMGDGNNCLRLHQGWYQAIFDVSSTDSGIVIASGFREEQARI